MKRIALVVLLLFTTGTVLHALVETPKTLEALFTTAEMPFTKLEDGRYFAVVTVDQESERFQVIQGSMGNDPKEVSLQFVRLYFKLGDLPQGGQLSAPLAKQMNTWNSNLSTGKVVVIEKTVWYTSFLWLDRTDAQALEREAVIGHLDCNDLRKELAPYLKP